MPFHSPGSAFGPLASLAVVYHYLGADASVQRCLLCALEDPSLQQLQQHSESSSSRRHSGRLLTLLIDFVREAAAATATASSAHCLRVALHAMDGLVVLEQGITPDDPSEEQAPLVIPIMDALKYPAAHVQAGGSRSSRPCLINGCCS